MQAATRRDGSTAKRSSLSLLVVLGLSFILAVSAVVEGTRKLGANHLYSIPSPSMEPTIDEGDRIAVDQNYYVQHAVADGDIVVVRHGKVMVVKRVLAMAGETIEGKGGVLFRNGTALNESYALHSVSDSISEIETFEVREVPVGEIFVAGDNRDKSLDSRSVQYGPVLLTDVIGKVKFVYFSRHAGQFGRSF